MFWRSVKKQPFDRCVEYRGNHALLTEVLYGTDTLVIPFYQGNVLALESITPWIVNLKTLSNNIEIEKSRLSFLGKLDNTFYFVYAIDENEMKLLQANYQLTELNFRSLLTILDSSLLEMLFFGRSLLHWHQQNQFCGSCGNELIIVDAGHRCCCNNKDCVTVKNLFPRLDPAIIVLVYDGDQCLLGRQASWDNNRYSTLAGFVEPGETLEQAIAREVKEEAGIEVSTFNYIGSQPWPFPSSLMLGFFAKAESVEIKLDDELEDAQWFSIDAIIENFKKKELKLPTRGSISSYLIDYWVKQKSGKTISELLRT